MPRKPFRSPRDWLDPADRSLFGKETGQSLKWQTPESKLDEALLAAAKQQCALAFKIRDTGGRRIETAALAASVDLHPETVRDIFNGSKHANLAVLHALSLGVGLKLTVGVKAVDPPSSETQTT